MQTNEYNNNEEILALLSHFIKMPAKNINLVHCAKGKCALLQVGSVIKEPESAFIKGCSRSSETVIKVWGLQMWVKIRMIVKRGFYFFSLHL